MKNPSGGGTLRDVVSTRIGDVMIEVGEAGLRRVELPDASSATLSRLPLPRNVVRRELSPRTTLAELELGPIERQIPRRGDRPDPDPAALVASVSRDIKLFFEAELEPEALWFEYPYDLSGQSPFSLRVMSAMMGIGPGQYASYAQLAASAGSPRGPRAAGGVVGSNPLSLVAPCHRVVGAGGRLTGYGGGLPMKVALLALERRMILGAV